jgi:predicted nucleotidyltransferase
MRKDLKKKLKQLGVSVVYLFGSRVIGRHNKLSDIDIGVVIKDFSLSNDTRALYTALYELFSELYSNSKIDIVFLQQASFPLQFSAIKNGKIYFEEDPIFTADYEYKVVNQYLDFKPVLDFLDHMMKERYA